MTETPVTLADIAALSALAQGILPADERDAGAALVHAGPSIAAKMRHGANGPIYAAGLRAAERIAGEKFGRAAAALDAAELHELLGLLRDADPMFFRLLRADVCTLYLSDPGVWRRIGFPGPSSESGGHPDFDTPQTSSRS
jgi:hypothetical protein